MWRAREEKGKWTLSTEKPRIDSFSNDTDRNCWQPKSERSPSGLPLFTNGKLYTLSNSSLPSTIFRLYSTWTSASSSHPSRAHRASGDRDPIFLVFLHASERKASGSHQTVDLSRQLCVCSWASTGDYVDSKWKSRAILSSTSFNSIHRMSGMISTNRRRRRRRRISNGVLCFSFPSSLSLDFLHRLFLLSLFLPLTSSFTHLFNTNYY